MTTQQRQAIKNICYRYNIEGVDTVARITNEFVQGYGSLPADYVCGWILDRIYIGISPEGRISS